MKKEIRKALSEFFFVVGMICLFAAVLLNWVWPSLFPQWVARYCAGGFLLSIGIDFYLNRFVK